MQEPSPAPSPLPLSYEGVTVIVGGGSVDLELLRALHAEGHHLIGADGGGDVIAAAGLVPDAVIGDLDSLRDPSGWGESTRVIRLTEQVTTDFEKVLYSTRSPVAVALGMTGKRFDHTLAALDAVMRYAQERCIILVDEHDIALVVSGSFAFSVEPGERISVHPLAPVTFRRSLGLVYPLDGLRLAPGERTGTSNRATEGAFSLEVGEGQTGAWLLILQKLNLFRLIEALMQ